MSIITITNGSLSASVNTAGGAFHSIVMNGIEYLWQGDAKYWKSRDYILFPYVGRFTDGGYTYKGQKYLMNTHGFARGKEFEVTALSESSVTLTLTESEDTLACFPFRFRMDITYTVSGSRVSKTISVTNTGDDEMYFGLGGHPGFNIPINGEGEFTDWCAEFPGTGSPSRIFFNYESYRLSGVEEPYPLEDGCRLPLQHCLFDNDAIVLKDMPRAVTLRSDASEHSVTVSFPETPFVGLWHAVKTDAPYVCIEPWVSLPSHHDYVEDFEKQPDLVHLEAGETYLNNLYIDIK